MIQQISDLIHSGLPITYIRNNNELHLKMLKEWGINFDFGDKFYLSELSDDELKIVLDECEKQKDDIYIKNIRLVGEAYNSKPQITTQGIVDKINSNTILSLTKRQELTAKKQELENTLLYKQIEALEQELSNISKEDTELREQGKQLLMDAGLKKFEALDGTIVQLNKKPGALIVEDETKVPQEYFVENTTKSIDKKKLKDDIVNGCIVEGCSISEDYTLVIKQGE